MPIQCITIEAADPAEYDSLFSAFVAGIEAQNKSFVFQAVQALNYDNNRITQTVYYFTVDNPTIPT